MFGVFLDSKLQNVLQNIGVGMGQARWAIAHPLLKVGGPAIGFGPPTFLEAPFLNLDPFSSPQVYVTERLLVSLGLDMLTQ